MINLYILLLEIRWNDEEKAGAVAAFSSYFEGKTVPSLKIIAEQKKNKKYCSILKKRTPQQIKAWIANKIKKN